MAKIEIVKFLDQWQTLAGSFIGPFLAVALSAIAYCIRVNFKKRAEYKEFSKQIEISITKSINDIYVLRAQLNDFVKRLKLLASDAKQIDNSFFLNRINFPTIREIYRNIELQKLKIKSYYLHNKLMWVDAAIKETNETMANLKNEFYELIRQNEMLVSLIRSNKNPDPLLQRKEYAINLERFAEAIEKYVTESIPSGIKTMTQIKIHNNHIRKPFGYWFRWRYEGLNFKYFRNKSKYKKFTRNLDSMDRIDAIIEKEVNFMIDEAEKRVKKQN